MYTSTGISFNSLQKFLLKTFTVLAFANASITQQVLAQVSDNFSDGDFTFNPAWTGTDLKFTVAANQVKLQAPVLNDWAYLSTPSNAINDASWEFFVKMDFNPSSTNFTRIYLNADQPDLSGSLNGYFIMVGNTNDEVSLYKQSGTTRTKIIDGLDGRLNLSVVNVRVKVTRDQLGNWQLYSDVGSTGVYTPEGNITDATFESSSFFGFYCEYTATRSDLFYFDDVAVTGSAFTDNTPPDWELLSVVSSNQLELTFSEPLQVSSTEELLNYAILGLGNPQSAVLTDDRKVNLSFQEAFTNGEEMVLSVSAITDIFGNAMAPEDKPFLYFQPSPVGFKDIIITEIFADYSPVVGLPEGEFVEIYNGSDNPVSLENWKLSDGNSIGIIPFHILLPHKYVILCANTFKSYYENLGSTAGITNFPTLNNSKDKLHLKNSEDVSMDSLHYSDQWYRDEDKKVGGWSLEMIDPANFCKGSDNWTSSTDLTGGTPGKQNSVFTNLADNEGPKLLQIITIADTVLQLNFDETLRSELPSLTSITIEPSVTILKIEFKEDMHGYNVTLQQRTEDERMYRVDIKDIYDCPGNLIEKEFGTAYLNTDTIPPSIDSLVTISSTEIEIYFSEKIIQATAEEITNYALTGNATPETAILLAPKMVRLKFSQSFPNGVTQSLWINNVGDLNGNFIRAVNKSFLYFQKSEISRRDIVITEIFSDPTPVIGLPEAEFIEIYNRSINPIDLGNWILTDRHSIGKLGPMIIHPGEYFILTSKASVPGLSIFGKTLEVSNFPSLNNSKDTLVLKSPSGEMIDSLIYTPAWYHDDDKRDGGWTMEMIDPENICKGMDNWIVSSSTWGGTPGIQNSAFAVISDNEGPQLQFVLQVSDSIMELHFNEKLSGNLPLKTDFTLQPIMEVADINYKTESSLRLKLTEAIEMGRTYVVSVQGIRDCPGNEIDPIFSKAFLNYDTIAPYVLTKEVSSRQIKFFLSEKLIVENAENLVNYSLVWDGSHPVLAQVQGDTCVLLTFSSPFKNGVDQGIVIHNLTDINGNAKTDTVSFLFFEETPYARKDIIVTEIFADPSPIRGLPESEFVEIFNRSVNPINLGNWKFSDGSSHGVLPFYIILPGEYLILCSVSLYPQFKPYGKVIGVPNFPGLNNTGEAIVLKDPSDLVIDSVNYSQHWYQSEEGTEGGYSLELIDPNNTCAEESNWISSENENGGTPGKQNSVLAEKPDLSSPQMISVLAASPAKLQISFNEKLENRIPGFDSFNLTPVISIDSVSFPDISLTGLNLHLQSPLNHQTLYSIILTEIYDCTGNKIEGNNIKFALPDKASSSDVVINEVLFNPRPNGVDFVEIYNRTDKFINLKNWSLVNPLDSLTSIKVFSAKDRLIMPLSYLVITTDKRIVMNEYPRSKDDNILEDGVVPSMNDESGSIGLLDEAGNLIDQFSYVDKMHSRFIKDPEGVSLERVSFDETSESIDNWKSANESSGFATPGYLNGNAVTKININEERVQITPEIFEPQSGQPNFTQIYYRFDKGGFIANVKVYDSQGRTIRELATNELLGADGFFRWDGDDEKGRKVRVGSYMVWFEIFDDKGSVVTFRKRVAIAGRF